jgi:hypothetical protein
VTGRAAIAVRVGFPALFIVSSLHDRNQADACRATLDPNQQHQHHRLLLLLCLKCVEPRCCPRSKTSAVAVCACAFYLHCACASVVECMDAMDAVTTTVTVFHAFMACQLLLLV